MKFIYGKQDWATLQRGQENCYLLTNGLGGFSSATMLGSNSRNDHALLMACIEAPNHRCNMIHRLEERLEREGESIPISTQEYVDKSRNERGFRFLCSFVFEDYPCWTYQVNGVEIVKELAMEQGENLVAVRYRISNRSKKDAALKVTPHLQFAAKGAALDRKQIFTVQKKTEEAYPDEKAGNIAAGEDCKRGAVIKEQGKISSQGLEVYFKTNGETECFAQSFSEDLYYAYDACDGRMACGSTCVNHCITKKIKAGARSELEIVYSMKEIHTTAGAVLEEAVRYRKELEEACRLKSEAGRTLAKSANQFVAERASTKGKTMLAGFPFFEDWGRDTMIALAGCCITTGQTDTAKSILRTFAAYTRDGLMPNLFPEGKNAPQYNTVDAALLFINAVYLFYEKTGDLSFAEEMYPVMEEIIAWYKRGTSYGIRMDEDGLIMAGQGLDQVTWMDVRVGKILPTPRHGKPVEINAYWYNALCIMDYIGDILHEKRQYALLAKRVKKSFCKAFWNEEKGCLRDVISESPADGQIRCNQIWAVSMPFTALTEEQEKGVVDRVFEKLYTPYGLRTLEMEDAQFRGVYGGAQLERDLAYHQGTVWVFPLGAYYLAYLKTRRYSREAIDTVRRQLAVMESAMREGCIGQLPEIYDGENPTFSRGCFAQAWSVGEILRVYEALEKDKPQEGVGLRKYEPDKAGQRAKEGQDSGEVIYRNVLFDLYGTLVDIHTDEESEEVWKKMALFYGYYRAYYAPAELRAAFKSLIREEQKKTEEIQIETIFYQLFSRKEICPTESMALNACRIFRILTTEYIQLYPGTKELLESLRGQGRRLYLLTNAQRAFTGLELQLLGLDKYFEKICISSDYGVKKPNVRFFRELLEECGLRAEECLMIGNDEFCDIAGGQGAGLDTLYLHTNLSPQYTGRIKADWMQLEQVKNMTEVLDILNALEEEAKTKNQGSLA